MASPPAPSLDVGVVIPLFNKRNTINRALASVFAQTTPAAAVVVVDDGSTDGSAEAIAGEWREKIDLIRVANGGPGAARNLGATLLNTALLAFLDADDQWKPRFLDTAVTRLTEEPACGAFVAAYDLGAAACVQREELRRLFRSSGAYEPAIHMRAEDLKSYIDSMHSSSSVVRSVLFRRLGGFFGRERCLFGEDSWLWIQVAFAGPVWFERERLTHFHVEDSGLGHARAGQHPRLPAIRFADELRSTLLGGHVAAFDRLLAYYRLLETEALARRGLCRDIGSLRRELPWPSRPSARLSAREIRVRIYCMRAMFGRPAIRN